MTIEIPDIIMDTLKDNPFKIIEENLNKTTLEVTNPKISSFETNIYLEFTPYNMEITFGNYHKSYATKDNNNYAILANCLNDIIYNNVCTTTLYYYEKDNIKKCAVNLEPTTTVLTKEFNNLFPNLSLDEDLRTRIKANGGEIHIQYWDIEQNKILIIPNDENSIFDINTLLKIKL